MSDDWVAGIPPDDGTYWVYAKPYEGWTGDNDIALVRIEKDDIYNTRRLYMMGSDDGDAENDQSKYSFWKCILFWKKVDEPQPPQEDAP